MGRNRTTLDALTPDLLSRRLHSELGFRLAAVSELDPDRPHNNRLLHLVAADGRQAVVKHYFADDRQRLDREYETLISLRTRRMTEVPTPLLRDDAHQFAVYSFEPGTIQAGTALTAPTVRAIAHFAAQLYHIHPDPGVTNLRTAVSATFSLAQQVAGIRRRLAEFHEFASGPQAGSLVRALRCEVAIEDEIERLIRRALAGRSWAAIEHSVPAAHWSLTSGDLAPHNILVRAGGGICVLDFEYSGWDDPAILLADFLSADSARGLSDACRRAFVETFRDLTDPSPDAWQQSWASVR